MNYEDEYDGYDDVYGHSVEDDSYGLSPSTAQMYLYDREKDRSLSSYMAQEDDIPEEPVDTDSSLQESSEFSRPILSDVDEARLNSCLEGIRSILGESVPEHVMIDAVLRNSFEHEKALNDLLTQQEAPKPQRIRTRRSRGSRGSASSDTEKNPQPVITTNATTTPAAEDIQSMPGPVARMTFSSSKLISSGFTPEKNPSESPLVDEIVAKSAKRDLLADMDDSNQTEKVSAKKDSGLEVPTEPSGILTPKKEGGGNSRSASPAPTPKAPGKKHDNEEAKSEYDKRKKGGKDYINLVVIGHVDAGKSTLMGHVLYQLGFVNKRTMHKYETESKKLGKASFAYAWVLDETEEERARGVTMDVAQTRFETNSKTVTLLDAPGHKDFIPNMITGAAQADVAVMVINAARGEFETGFDAGGQTREHAMLVRSLGVSQLAVAVNKLDMVDWSEERYKEIRKKIGLFLKQAGFKDTDVTFVPCSGLVGENLTKPPTDAKLSWFKGPSLLEAIDKFKPPTRQVDKPLRMCIADVFKGMGSGVWVSGTLQAGAVSPGEKVLVMPQGVSANIKSITIDEAPVKYAFAGDNAVLVMTGIDITHVGIGNILCDPSDPVRTSNRIQARVVIFNIDVPITKGFPVVFHYQSMSEPASVKRLISQLHKSTGEVIRSKPRCLVKNSSAVIELEINRPVCIELYKDYKDLGRFMLRYGGSTIAAGLVTEIKDTKVPKTE